MIVRCATAEIRRFGIAKGSESSWVFLIIFSWNCLTLLFVIVTAWYRLDKSIKKLASRIEEVRAIMYRAERERITSKSTLAR